MEQKVEIIARTFRTVVSSHTWMPPVWFNFPWESFQGKIRWGIRWLLSFPAWNSLFLDWTVRCALNLWNGKWLQICRWCFLFAACLSRVAGMQGRGMYSRYPQCTSAALVLAFTLQPASEQIREARWQGYSSMWPCPSAHLLLSLVSASALLPHLFITIKPFTTTNTT
jgi:hypothetical protein